MPSRAALRSTEWTRCKLKRVHAARGFVQDEHLGSGKQRRRDAQTLSHSEAVNAHFALGGVTQLEQVQDLAYSTLAHATCQPRVQLEVAAARQIRIKGGGRFDHRAELPPHQGLFKRVDAEQLDAARTRKRQARHEPDDGRFARPVRPDQGVHFAGVDLEGDVPDDRTRTVTLGQPLCFDSRRLCGHADSSLLRQSTKGWDTLEWHFSRFHAPRPYQGYSAVVKILLLSVRLEGDQHRFRTDFQPLFTQS